MPDLNLALNGLALDALQALAFIFTLLAAALFALLGLALGLTAGGRRLRRLPESSRQQFALARSVKLSGRAEGAAA